MLQVPSRVSPVLDVRLTDFFAAWTYLGWRRLSLAFRARNRHNRRWRLYLDPVSSVGMERTPPSTDTTAHLQKQDGERGLLDYVHQRLELRRSGEI